MFKGSLKILCFEELLKKSKTENEGAFQEQRKTTKGKRHESNLKALDIKSNKDRLKTSVHF